jgi:hypothetical protein
VKKILSLAKHHNINVKDESHLLWILKEWSETPLPPEWNRMLDGKSGEVVYTNEITGEIQEEDPSSVYFLTLIAKERERLSPLSLSSPAPQHAVLELVSGVNGKTYYYDFIAEQLNKTKQPPTS